MRGLWLLLGEKAIGGVEGAAPYGVNVGGFAGCGPMWSSAPTDADVLNLVRTWKTLITKELGQSIWQRSCYDHVIRNEQEYCEIAEYIIGNPGKWVEDTYFIPSLKGK